MAGMKDRLELVTEAIDKNDPHQRVIRTSRSIYADKRPLHAGEFHAAAARGFEVQYIMKVRAFEYKGERLAVYQGQEYRIYRTYETNDDWTELYLTNKRANTP